MKKLLSLLGATVLASSSVIPVVSCSYNTDMSSATNMEAEFYSRVSAQAFKSAILNDQTLNISGHKENIDYHYSSTYLGSQKILAALPGLFPDGGVASATDTSIVSSLYDTTFGKQQGGYNYTVFNSFGSLKDNNGVKQGTVLSELVNANDKGKSIGTMPDSTVSTLAVAITNIAKILFSNDFSSSIASTALNLLNSQTAKDEIGKGSKYFDQIDHIFSKFSAGIKEIIKSATQQDIAAEILEKNPNKTVGQQLKDSTESLFEGLIFLVSKKSKIYNDKNSEKDDAATAFWNLLLNKDSSDLIDAPADDSGKAQTNNMMKYLISPIVSFGVTFLHFLRMFDKDNKLSAYQITSGEKIFSTSEKNEKIKSKVLNEKYISGTETDDYWYEDGTTHSLKLNLQNFFSDLEYYLSPVDSRGSQTLRLISIILGGVDDGTDTPDLNPIIDTALSPLINLLIGPDGKLSKIMKTISKIPGLDSKKLSETINNFINTSIKQLINWLATDGDDLKSTQTIKTFVGTIGGILSAVPFDKISNLEPSVKKYCEILKSVSQFINSFAGTKFVVHPWTQIYGGGLFYSIGSLPVFKDSSNYKLAELGYGLRNLKDIRNISLMKINDLMLNIGYIIGKAHNDPLQVESFLYSIGKMSIKDVVSLFAKLEETNMKKTLSENSDFSLSTGAIGSLVASIMPNSDINDAKKVNDEHQTYIKDGNGNIVSPVMPLFYAIKYNGSKVDISSSTDDADTDLKDAKSYSITIPEAGITDKMIVSSTPIAGESSNVDTNAISYLLGVSTDEKGVASFIPGSLLYNISKLYGHNYTTINDKGVQSPIEYKDMTNGAESIFNILSSISDLIKQSLSDLINDDYAKYYDPRNWMIKNIKQSGLDVKDPMDRVEQQLDYDLCFHNVDTKKWVTYHVKMTRDPYPDDSINYNHDKGWVLKELMLQN